MGVGRQPEPGHVSSLRGLLDEMAEASAIVLTEQAGNCRCLPGRGCRCYGRGISGGNKVPEVAAPSGVIRHQALGTALDGRADAREKNRVFAERHSEQGAIEAKRA
jgi:hypothetical protein